MHVCCSRILFTDSVSQARQTTLLIISYIHPFVFIPTATSLALGPISFDLMLCPAIHPSPSTLTLSTAPSHLLASQGPFIYALPSMLFPSICPCVPPSKSHRSKYCSYWASSWLSAALQISSTLSYTFLKSSDVSEIRKHLIFKVRRNCQPQS